MIKIKEFYEIECEALEIVVKELNIVVKNQNNKKENEEFFVILEDMMESVEASIELIKGYKLNAGMTTLRNAYELLVTYIAVIKNENHRANYLDTTKKRNIKNFSDEVSKLICKDIYIETYSFLCEFAHPTLQRSYFCDIGKTNGGKDFNLSLGIFLLVETLGDYITYLKALENDMENTELNSLLYMLLSAFGHSLKNKKIDEKLKEKYHDIFFTNKELLDMKQEELENMVNENKDFIVQALLENIQCNKTLKIKIINYMNK